MGVADDVTYKSAPYSRVLLIDSLASGMEKDMRKEVR